MARRKKKWKPTGPEPGDEMVEIYDAIDGKVIDCKTFRHGDGCLEFLNSLPNDSLAKVYRFTGWELVQEQGHWYED